MRALLALGSNLGDRAGYLSAAVGAMDELVAESDVWETAPVGGPDDQGPYLNMVVALETERSPRELLELAQKLEADAGRQREVRWGARTLDVDVLWIDGVTVDEADLVVPHPRLFERAFVLAPLADVAPDVAGLDWQQRVDASGVVRLGPLPSL